MANLATMSTMELEAHGRALADRLNNPDPHVCVNADTCAAVEADRVSLLEGLAAARMEWLTRKNIARPLAS